MKGKTWEINFKPVRKGVCELILANGLPLIDGHTGQVAEFTRRDVLAAVYGNQNDVHAIIQFFGREENQ